MATSTITIADCEDGGVSIEIAYDVLPPGIESKAQQVADALRSWLRDLDIEFHVPAAQDAG